MPFDMTSGGGGGWGACARCGGWGQVRTEVPCLQLDTPLAGPVCGLWPRLIPCPACRPFGDSNPMCPDCGDTGFRYPTLFYQCDSYREAFSHGVLWMTVYHQPCYCPKGTKAMLLGHAPRKPREKPPEDPSQAPPGLG